MKFWATVAVLVCVVQLVCSQEGEKPKEISGKFLENLNVDELLQNARYVETQISCILSRGKCDRTGREFTDILPEYFQRKCDVCSESQRTKTDKITAHVSQHYPEDWALIVQKYS